MLYIMLGLGFIIIVLLVFLYSIWKDEKEIPLDLDAHKKDAHEAVFQKKYAVSPDNFSKSLSKLVITDTKFLELKEELGKKIIGMDEFVNSILVNMLTGGHLLVEGVPGLAKTKTIHTLSEILDMDFKRIQFTPDMLPSDITGSEIYNTRSKEFEIKKGPVFTNILLADEINRTTPKVQSALLESMQEKQVTIGGKNFPLPAPFFVMATQNPLEQEGTYPLPEAQIDRFLFKVVVDYPNVQEEKGIVNTLEDEENIKIKKVLNQTQFIKIQQTVKNVKISDDIKDYIVRLVQATRNPDPRILYGASPRASIGLLFGAKALAYLQGRDYVTHEDVQMLALNIFRHRILLTYDAKVEGYTQDDIILELLPNITLE